MKFLVILVCLLVNHYWQEDRALNGDAWFVRFRNWLSERLQGKAIYATHPVIKPVLLLALPLILLYLLLWLIDDVLLGFITLGVHVLILLIACDRLNMPHLVAQYLESWRAGDYEGAHVTLQQRLEGRFGGIFMGYAPLHGRFRDLLLASYFERLFAVVFWYLLLGPGGVLVYALLRMYLVMEDEPAGPPDEPAAESAQIEWLRRLLLILEWVPARLLALTFCLAGDFVAAFAGLRERFAILERGLVIVRATALAALGLVSARLRAVPAGAAADVPEPGDTHLYPEWAATEIDELMSLLMRSQVIWMTFIALLTLYGID